ncbi:MAG: hypothetical protein MSC31_05680 [Solirubrobacteraceae bacterium MAG38_C4-C5]|nr:hypothetical protein [Candidatus Siliceabacter maunaloa]
MLERGREVVADLGDVPGDDFGEVGELLRERGETPLFGELGELPDLLLGDRCAFLGGVERQALLLEGEAVDVGVLDGVRLDGHLGRESLLLGGNRGRPRGVAGWRAPVSGVTP